MNEADHLRERARGCHRLALATKFTYAVKQLEAQAAEFERRAASLEARGASLR
jgi:hypothetical protein